MSERVKIDVNEAIRYMGYREKPSDVEMTLIKDCCELLESEITPRYVYRVFDIEPTADGVRLVGSSLVFKGKDIVDHLEGCEKCVLLCATASARADEIIRLKETQDMAQGYMTDCLASAAVESICNELEAELAKKLSGWYFTWRFSPGYGDFPLDIQPDIIETLNAGKRAGVSCTESLLLVPRKSVTAVIGLSSKPIENQRRGCAICSMSDKCEFRKKGTHCGF